jgi:hypothetical protein
MLATYYLGLDLGQTTDFSALAVVERKYPPPSGNEFPDPSYLLRHLQRFPLGTPYAAIVTAVSELVSSRHLREQSVLAVDQTGVGRPVVEMLRKAGMPCRIVAETITGGQAVNIGEDGSFRVPKKELVTRLQVLLLDQRLKIARGLAAAKLPVSELLNFRVKITAATNETFEAWRERDHDDLVLAVAVAVWYAERDNIDYDELPWGVMTPGRRPI